MPKLDEDEMNFVRSMRCYLSFVATLDCSSRKSYIPACYGASEMPRCGHGESRQRRILTCMERGSCATNSVDSKLEMLLVA